MKNSNRYRSLPHPCLVLACVILGLVADGMTRADARASAAAPLVVIGTAERAAVIDEVPLSGTISSPRVARLSSEVNGLIETIRVDAGDRVKEGDVLLTLDPELEELSLDASRAVTEQARQELGDAKRRLADAEMLAKRKTISANELRSLEAEVRIDSAALQRYGAEQRRQEARLRRHELQAPFAGVISSKLVETGEWVQPGTTVLELTAMDGLRIDFQVPQAEFPEVTPASEVRVTLGAFPGQVFAAKIAVIVPVSDPAARTFLMRVTLVRTDVAMMPGMSASGVLRLDAGEQGIVVSRDALLRYPDGRVTVWVVDDSGETPTVSERLVKTGPTFNGQVVIVEGLGAAVPIVVEGNESLKEGQVVTIKRSE